MKLAVAAVLALSVPSLLAQIAHGEDAYRLLVLDGYIVKWGATEFATPASITYAILDGETTASGVRNCQDVRGVESMLAHAGLSREVLETELDAAVADWEAVANVRFRQTADVDAADIVIGAQADPDGWAFADVRTAEPDSGGIVAITKGIVCLNPERAWGARGVASEAKQTFDLRYVLTHEIGHLLGLDHSSARGGLMSFHYDEKFREIGPGDIAGVVALYGRPEKRLELIPIASDEPSIRASEDGVLSPVKLAPPKKK